MSWSIDYSDWRIYKRFEDLNSAYLIGLREAPAAIYAETSYHVEEFLKGILPALLQLCIVQAASTVIGAGIGAGLGAFVFGAGAIPGAAIGAELGFDLGLAILTWLGLAFLVVAIGHSLGDIVSLIKTAVVQAWGAADKGEARGQNVRQAGQTLARAIAILVRLILTGIVAWLTKKGLDKAPELIAELKASKLGAGFAAWVEKNLSKLMNDPKLRGHKQSQGSAAKAVESEAQTPSQMARRPVEEAPPPPPPPPKPTLSEVKAMPKGSRPDPKEYLSKEHIDSHLAEFKDGASRFTLKSNLDKYGVAQRDGTTFVMPKGEADRLLASTKGNPRALEEALGLPENTLANSELMRVDIPSPEKFNLRIPSGNEAGANDLWIPGGKLPNGNLEAVLDAGKLPPDAFTATPIRF